MDDDTYQLVIKLCSEAGSIMEFASADAITIRSFDKAALPEKLDQLIDQSQKAVALLYAAKAVLPEK